MRSNRGLFNDAAVQYLWSHNVYLMAVQESETFTVSEKTLPHIWSFCLTFFYLLIIEVNASLSYSLSSSSCILRAPSPLQKVVEFWEYEKSSPSPFWPAACTLTFSLLSFTPDHCRFLAREGILYFPGETSWLLSRPRPPTSPCGPPLSAAATWTTVTRGEKSRF